MYDVLTILQVGIGVFCANSEYYDDKNYKYKFLFNFSYISIWPTYYIAPILFFHSIKLDIN